MNMSVELRDLDHSDLDLVYDWYNDPALYDTLVGEYTPRAREEAREYMRAHWIGAAATVRKIIMADGQTIGLIALSNIDRSEATAAFDIFIADVAARGKGYGRKALSQMLHAGFTDLGLERIYLDLLEDNLPARRIYERCGFAPRGGVQGTAVKNGVIKNIIRMELDKGDWRP